MKGIVIMGGGVIELRALGATTLVVPNDTQEAAHLIKAGEASGLVLTGGADVDPSLYGAKAHKRTSPAGAARNLAEYIAIEAAAERSVPTFGICRGMQMINVAYGGTLVQHLPDKGVSWHDRGLHLICPIRGTKFSRIASSGGAGLSLHHQAVGRVAEGFVVSGRSPDGVAEVLESRGGVWVMGVQFHPELHDNALSEALFEEFLAQCGGDRRPKPRPKLETRQHRPRSQPKQREQRKPVLHHDDRDEHGVRRYWQCFRCRIDFDLREDHLDHMLFLHEVDLRKGGKVHTKGKVR